LREAHLLDHGLDADSVKAISLRSARITATSVSRIMLLEGVFTSALKVSQCFFQAWGHRHHYRHSREAPLCAQNNPVIAVVDGGRDKLLYCRQLDARVAML
jgi:hypothetical protein